jgi:hypothetical protein
MRSKFANLFILAELIAIGVVIFSCSDWRNQSVAPTQNNEPMAETSNPFIFDDSPHWSSDAPSIHGLQKIALPYKSSMTLNRVYHNVPAATTGPVAYTWSLVVHANPVDKNGAIIGTDAIKSAIQWGLNSWASVCGVSFVEAAPGAAASLNISFEDHCPWSCGAGASGGGANITYYCNLTCGGIVTPILWGWNAICYSTIHEAGHVLGLMDMRRNGCYSSNNCGLSSAAYNGIPPSAQCLYDGMSAHTCPSDWEVGDPTYYSWRMSFAGTPYDVLQDTHLSVMDYDNRTGWWGFPRDPDIGQPAYPSKYDIECVKEHFGVPEYVNLWIMYFEKDRSGNDYGGTQGANGFVSSDFDEVNSLTRSFGPPTDIGGSGGLVSRTTRSGTVALYRYYKKADLDYQISTATSLTGYTRQVLLGYIWTSGGSVSLQIGTSTKTHTTAPLFQYYNATIKKHKVWAKDVVPEPGWTKSLVGYTVPFSELGNP